jgi:hypothetical protein
MQTPHAQFAAQELKDDLAAALLVIWLVHLGAKRTGCTSPETCPLRQYAGKGIGGLMKVIDKAVEHEQAAQYAPPLNMSEMSDRSDKSEGGIDALENA